MIICNKCGAEKPLSDYYLRKNGKIHSKKCKECTRVYVAENLKKVGNTYNFSEKGVIRILYKSQKRSNKLRGFGNMPYTKEEFKSWLYENGYKDLFDTWVGYMEREQTTPI